MYTLINGSWTQLGQDINGGTNEEFGFSVSLSAAGNTVAIGAPGNGFRTGYTNIYRLFSGSSWVQLGSTISGDGGDIGGQSGYSVSLSEDGLTVAIGTPHQYATDGSTAGITRIYKLYGSGWTKISIISAHDINDSCGYSVSISSDGNTVVVGSRSYNNNRGLIRVYKNLVSNNVYDLAFIMRIS